MESVMVTSKDSEGVKSKSCTKKREEGFRTKKAGWRAEKRFEGGLDPQKDPFFRVFRGNRKRPYDINVVTRKTCRNRIVLRLNAPAGTHSNAAPYPAIGP